MSAGQGSTFEIGRRDWSYILLGVMIHPSNKVFPGGQAHQNEYHQGIAARAWLRQY